MRLNARVVTACQVLLTSQPSWRLESDKPFTREGDLFFEGLCGLISTADNRRIFALMSVEVGSSSNWWERRMCFTIFVFLAKMGTMSLISVPTVRQPFYLQLNLCNYKMWFSLPLTSLLLLLMLLQNVTVNSWWKRMSKLNPEFFLLFVLQTYFVRDQRSGRKKWQGSCEVFVVFAVCTHLWITTWTWIASEFILSAENMCIAFLLCINQMSLSVKVSLLAILFKVSGAIYCMCLLINYIFG